MKLPWNRKTILLADDESQLTDLLSIRLKSVGFNVLVAKNGSETVKMAFSGPPDLIILDITMPVFNGFQICKMLRQNPDTMDIPVIILTASGSMDDMEKGLKFGSNEYIVKPYDWNELYDKIRKLLGEEVLPIKKPAKKNK